MKLIPPCSYQGGKQRLANQIVDIIFEQNSIDENTKFYDLCCGSGAVTLELINRGVNPSNIFMIDNGCFGYFWKSVSDGSFDISIFKSEIMKLPDINLIQSYLQELSDKKIDNIKMIYHYLLLQSGSFGSKQIWAENNTWKNNSFRSYWLPTATSNRKSPVNPMMPMPNTLYERVENIVLYLKSTINASNSDISTVDFDFDNNSIVYIDPPYKNTTGYGKDFDYEKFISLYESRVNIYISEATRLESATDAILLSSGRSKGNISGDVKKKPVEEWLNIFKAK